VLPTDGQGSRNHFVHRAFNGVRSTQGFANSPGGTCGIVEASIAATADQVDCLVCHDHSGQYEKEPTGAGTPKKGVNLLKAAKSVGRTDRSHCGACHFKGGGGDGVKHGDLDESMYFPPERVDAHMGKHDLRCADCHRAERHAILGRLDPEKVPLVRWMEMPNQPSSLPVPMTIPTTFKM